MRFLVKYIWTRCYDSFKHNLLKERCNRVIDLEKKKNIHAKDKNKNIENNEQKNQENNYKKKKPKQLVKLLTLDRMIENKGKNIEQIWHL